MKIVTIRDLRQRWRETKKALQTEQEILVTRDSKPVARLIRYVEPVKKRKRFDPAAHGEWQRKMSGGKITRWVDQWLLRERDERNSLPPGLK
jgi:antitoxin (DNA-binding transcriptional repressor) of toxin-antitoxin stability system